MASNKRLLTLGAVLFGFNMVMLVFVGKMYVSDKYFITINAEQVIVNILPEDFLSIGIDTSVIENNGKLNFSNKRLQDLVSFLAPARLRLGGTMSDRLIFSKEDVPQLTCEDCHDKHSKHVCGFVRKLCKKNYANIPFVILTGPKWKEINEFCNATNLKLLFSLNVLLRNESGWNEQNAKELLTFSKLHHYKIDFELGNEPNSFPHKFNTIVNPKALASDFKKLRKVLNENGFEDSLLVGPDTTRPQSHRPECLKYMVEFLGNGSQYINVRSWHQYYLNSRTAKLEDFWCPKTFNLLEEQIQTMKNNTEKYVDKPMWLSETSSSYGGGAPGLSDTFAGTPLWLDKLGMSAKYNITTVIRQSFIGGNYSLVDHDLNPLPDWWVSVLFKKLVGNKVLNIKYYCQQKQRLYAHCANRKYTDDRSAIVIYGMNLQLEIIKFIVNGTAIRGENLSIDEFLITTPSNKRTSDTVLLNGWPLIYNISTEMKPRHIKYGNKIMMPPNSVGFWVIKNTTLNICN